MTGEMFVFAVIALLATVSVGVLIVALLRGRRPPMRKGPWVAALVVTVIPAIFITMVAVVAGVHGSGWLAFGAIGLWALVGLTVVNARWAAWAYLASGVAFPIILTVGSLLLPVGEALMIEPTNALVYTARVIVAAGLLIWATQRAHHPSVAPRARIRPT